MRGQGQEKANCIINCGGGWTWMGVGLCCVGMCCKLYGDSNAQPWRNDKLLKQYQHNILRIYPVVQFCRM